jgi:hypothetical protein
MKDIPAFPVFPETGVGHASAFQGMTLRDYFAAKAMQVVMPSVIAELQRKSYSDEKTKLLKNTSAEACYGMADAMMKAREA